MCRRNEDDRRKDDEPNTVQYSQYLLGIPVFHADRTHEAAKNASLVGIEESLHDDGRGLL